MPRRRTPVADPSPDERLETISRILALGVERVRQAHQRAEAFNAGEPAACLEVATESRLTGENVPRVNAAENLQRGEK